MHSVEEYIYDLRGQQKAVMEYLHQLLETYPGITSKIRYKVPFYYRKSWICYLNPVKGDQVELSFTRGNELSNEQGILDFRGRKQVAGILFPSVESIKTDVIAEIIQEAIMLDEEVPYASKRKLKNR